MNTLPQSPAPIPSIVPASIWSLPTQRAALAGAVGGLIGFLAGEMLVPMSEMSDGGSLSEMMVSSGMWAAIIGMCLGLTILAYDNWQGLRGKWHRDLGRAVPMFLALGFCGGALGEGAYSWVQNSLTRGIGWALMGLVVGAGIGLLRRDRVQAMRGALGGAVGGFLGGFIFNALTLISSSGAGAFSRAVGLMMMGALIAVLMRVVQDALKSAWLIGITEGPYARREYPLNTERVSVGQSELNDIALYRERELPPQVGALVSQGGEWWWQGVPVAINGAMQSNTVLRSGDVLQFGATGFRYQTRSVAVAPQGLAPQNGADTSSIHGSLPLVPSPSSFARPAASRPSLFGASPSVVPPLVPPPMPQAPLVSQAQAAPPLSSPAVRDLPALAESDFALRGAMGETLRLPPAPSRANVGRLSDNQIVLSDEGVSGRHARFDIGRGALTITDLNSTNGTFLNGRRLQAESPALLREGDQLKFGRLEYQVIVVTRV